MALAVEPIFVEPGGYPALSEISRYPWVLPGHGERGENCGRWVVGGWCGCVDKHPDGRPVVLRQREECKSRGCPDHRIVKRDGGVYDRVGCGRKWVRRTATAIRDSLHDVVSSNRKWGIYEVIISFAEENVPEGKDDYDRIRRRAHRTLKRHCRGRVVGFGVAHGYRTVVEDSLEWVKQRGYDRDGMWDGCTELRDGLHFHYLVATRWTTPHNATDGTTVVKIFHLGVEGKIRWGKVLKKARYELGHSTWMGKGQHAIFPIGGFKYRDRHYESPCEVVEDGEAEESAKTNCPYCGARWNRDTWSVTTPVGDIPWGVPWSTELVAGWLEADELPPDRVWLVVTLEEDGSYEKG